MDYRISSNIQYVKNLSYAGNELMGMWYTLKGGNGQTVIVKAESSAIAIIKGLDVLKRQLDFKAYEVKIDIVEVRG